MNAAIFNELNLNERLMFLINYGEFMSEITFNGHKIKLYVAETFYIEEYFNINSSSIVKVEILDPADERISLYAKEVDIHDLLR